MPLSVRQLESLGGKFLIEPPDPVAERLAKLEEMLLNMAVPLPANIDTETLVERLARIEAMISGLAVEKLQTAVFQIERDTMGRISEVKAGGWRFEVFRNLGGKVASIIANRFVEKIGRI